MITHNVKSILIKPTFQLRRTIKIYSEKLESRLKTSASALRLSLLLKYRNRCVGVKSQEATQTAELRSSKDDLSLTG
mgnify:CR=1 FL=1